MTWSSASSSIINMESWWRFQSVLVVLCLLFTSLVRPAQAFDGGDAVALLLGMAVTVVGFCACLGWYARRRNGQF